MSADAANGDLSRAVGNLLGEMAGKRPETPSEPPGGAGDLDKVGALIDASGWLAKRVNLYDTWARARGGTAFPKKHRQFYVSQLGFWHDFAKKLRTELGIDALRKHVRNIRDALEAGREIFPADPMMHDLCHSVGNSWGRRLDREREWGEKLKRLATELKDARDDFVQGQNTAEGGADREPAVPGGGGDGPGTPDDPAEVQTPEIPRRAQKAYEQYRQAAEVLGTGEPTDRQAYDALQKAAKQAGELGDLPSFETWQRNLSECRRLTGTQKKKRRAGRAKDAGRFAGIENMNPEDLPTGIQRKSADE